MELYPYQKEAVTFILKQGSGLIADSVGLGKTLMTLGVIKATSPSSVLIVCPAILKWQWKEQIEKFLPEATAVIIDGTPEQRAAQWVTPAQIKIANYELLWRDFTFTTGTLWELMVCDEATRIANPWTKTYKSLYHIRARRRIALTGTPVSNRPNELWGILNWCFPGILGKYSAFLDRYCVRNIWGGIFKFQRLEELQKRIKPLMIRRLREEVLPQLPEKIVSDVPLQLSDRERELYDKIRKELLFEIEKDDISKLENPITIQHTLVRMLRLRQATNSLELIGKNKESSKLAGLKELLPDVLNGERKAIIFTFFSEMADILERELKDYAPLKITGEVDKREGIVRAFNDKPEHRLLIMTSAGQYGLNIQAASVVIHYDQEWSLAKMEQRVGRAHRIGQKLNVLEYNLLMRGTMDEYVRKVLRKKQELSKELLGDGVGAEDIKQILKYAV